MSSWVARERAHPLVGGVGVVPGRGELGLPVTAVRSVGEWRAVAVITP